jgi:hypothetical protein
MTRNQVIANQIEEIMDEFDFHECLTIFEKQEWSYHDAPASEMSVAVLRRTARMLLQSVSIRPLDGISYAGTGRFRAYMTENIKEKWLRLELLFVPEQWGIEDGGNYETPSKTK